MVLAVTSVHSGRILLGFENLLNFEKGRLQSLWQPETKNSRARNGSYFHWLKTGDNDILVIRYWKYSRPAGNLPLQNLKSLRCLRNLPAFEAESFEAFEACHFSETYPKEYVFNVCEVFFFLYDFLFLSFSKKIFYTD